MTFTKKFRKTATIADHIAAGGWTTATFIADDDIVVSNKNR